MNISLFRYLLCLSLVLAPCYEPLAMANQQGGGCPPTLEGLEGQTNQTDQKLTLKTQLERIEESHGELNGDAGVEQAMSDLPFHKKAFLAFRNTLFGKFNINSSEGRLNKLTQQMTVIFGRFSQAQFSKEKLAEHIANLPETIRSLHLPEWAKSFANSSFFVFALMVMAENGIVPGSENFEITWAKLGFGLLAGYFMGVGLLKTDDAIEELQDVVAEEFPTRRGEVEAIATNFPEGVMGSVFFLTTLAGYAATGDFTSGFLVGSVAGASVAMGSIGINGLMRILASFSNIKRAIFNRTSKRGSEFNDVIYHFAEHHFKNQIEKLKSSGKAFGPISTPILFTRALSKFMRHTFAKSSRSIVVYAGTLIPMGIFYWALEPMVQKAVQTDEMPWNTIVMLVAAFASLRISFSAVFRLNDRLNGGLDQQISAFGDSFNTDPENLEDALQYLGSQAELAKNDGKGDLHTAIEHLASYVRFQAKANSDLTEGSRKLARDAALGLKERIEAFLDNSEDIARLNDIIAEADARTPVAVRYTPLREGEQGESQHLYLMVTEILGVEMDPEAVAKPKAERWRALIRPVLKVSLASSLLGIGTFFLMQALEGMNPLLMALLGSILSSIPEKDAMKGHLVRRRQSETDNVAVHSNLVNLNLSDTNMGGSTIWGPPVMRRLKSFVLRRGGPN